MYTPLIFHAYELKRALTREQEVPEVIRGQLAFVAVLRDGQRYGHDARVVYEHMAEDVLRVVCRGESADRIEAAGEGKGYGLMSESNRGSTPEASDVESAGMAQKKGFAGQKRYPHLDKSSSMTSTSAAGLCAAVRERS